MRVGFLRRNVRRCPTLPRGLPRSTIGAEGLNFRVRDGTGCFPLAMAAATLWNYQPDEHSYLDLTADVQHIRMIKIRVFEFPAVFREPHSGREPPVSRGTCRVCKCVSSPRSVSTGQLSASRRLHFRPINPVVWLGALPTRWWWET